MEYFIIEHPTRGVLQSDPNANTGKPRFSWSGSRDEESAARYFTLRRAIQDAQELSDLPLGCEIRKKPSERDMQSGKFDWIVVWPVRL